MKGFTVVGRCFVSRVVSASVALTWSKVAIMDGVCRVCV